MKKKVLCVCEGNTCRSPMMVAILQRELGDEFQVESAGTMDSKPGPANPFATQIMRSKGFDLSAHSSRFIGSLDLTSFSHFVCVNKQTANHVKGILRKKRLPVIIANKANGGVPDPYERGMIAYEDCVALLERIIPEIADRIRSES